MKGVFLFSTFIWASFDFVSVKSGGGFTNWFDNSFTREVVATHNGFIGGIAFATDGDILANSCGGNQLFRFDLSTTSVVGGSTLFSKTILSGSDGGFCGMSNHNNGKLYVNTGNGVEVRDPDTNVFIEGPFGPDGNVLGLTVNDQTGDVYYVTGYDGTGETYKLDPSTNVVTLFATTNYWVDGLFFNSDRSILWHAGRRPNYRLIGVETATGNILHSIVLTHEPDGIAFHPPTNSIVLNNLDGTLTRISQSDLNTEILMASGGNRGDLSAVGADGCWYIAQDGTIYEDGSTSSLNSIVKICPDFTPTIGDNCQSFGDECLAIDVNGTHGCIECDYEYELYYDEECDNYKCMNETCGARPANCSVSNFIDESGCPIACDTSPCDCNSDCLFCREDVCHVSGCSQCIDGYFKKSPDYPCIQCQEYFGQECLHCQDFNGCGQCQDGYQRVWDSTCHLWKCSS